MSRPPVDRRPGAEQARQLLQNARALPDNNDLIDGECRGYERTDLGNAQRLVRRFRERLMFVPDVGWHTFDNGVWNWRSDDVEARRYAHSTALAIRDEALRVRDESEMSALARWGYRSQDSRRLTAMLREARTYLQVPVDDLNNGPFLVNVRNGTLELNAGDVAGANGGVRFREARPDDRITRQCNTIYDPEAKCPGFLKFMAECQPSVARRAMLQRFSGYSLSGLTVEQCILLNWGQGSNGKSTFIDAVADMMGDYSAVLPFESLLHDPDKRGSEASPDLARLTGRRLIRSSEPEAGVRFSDGMIKRLTSSEPISARHLHKGFFDFDPHFKLFVSFNPRPDVRGVDEGLWRRLILVPWDVMFYDAEDPKRPAGAPVKDLTLPERLREERAGILNWMLDGWRAYREMGLAIPPEVRDATREYREESDRLSGFLEAAIFRKPGSDEPARDIFAAYTLWCKQNAQSPMSQTAFGRAMRERGYRSEKRTNIHYVNVALVDAWRMLVDMDRAKGSSSGVVPDD